MALNLSTLELSAVRWPGHPPVAILPGGEQIVQLTSWVPALGCWVRLGSTERRREGQVIDLTFADWQYLSMMCATGIAPATVLGMLFPG